MTSLLGADFAMPSLKIYPPTRLPNNNVTETQFNMWQEELEVYLSQDPDFKIFLPNKAYQTWTSYEEDPNRIPDLKEGDTVVENDDHRNGRVITADEAIIANDEKLDNIRTSLRTVLSIVGKCVCEGHYTSVIKHSTSLRWIYNMLRCDYDIQNKGVHFFNVLEVKYNSSKHTPISFYNLYRTIISNNLAKRGDTLNYKNNKVLEMDEKFSPMLEDIVLLNVIREIDHRLPNIVKTFYFHKMKREERLMDFKTDILLNIPQFLEQLNEKGDDDAILSSFKNSLARKGQKKGGSFNSQRKGYCRLCYLNKQTRPTYTSHNFGDISCPSITSQDRKNFMEVAKLSAVQDENEEAEEDDEELAEMYGYGQFNNCQEQEDNQVQSNFGCNIEYNLDRRKTPSKCGFVQPVSSQILTLFVDIQNNQPFHIELDSGATISYIREDVALKCNFKIIPNKQTSKLGDGLKKNYCCW